MSGKSPVPEAVQRALLSINPRNRERHAPFTRAELALAERVQARVEQLPEPRRLVINQRFGLDGTTPKTLQNIGSRLSRTRERVRQLQQLALADLAAMV